MVKILKNRQNHRKPKKKPQKNPTKNEQSLTKIGKNEFKMAAKCHTFSGILTQIWIQNLSEKSQKWSKLLKNSKIIEIPPKKPQKNPAKNEQNLSKNEFKMAAKW